MLEVYPHLWVGDQQDYESWVKGQKDWYTIHACKEPYHRQALGYTTRGAPKNHPDYLYCYKYNELILNMVDGSDPAFFSRELIDEAMDVLDRFYPLRKNMLIHCNRGESRAPSLALLWLAQRRYISHDTLQAAERDFALLYPPYDPSPGINLHLFQNWSYYMGEVE